ncbi:MAG TPA: anthranilate phosphoribosyltransferase [Candidatus Merdousia gallistercoris]|nr:anthranilate phosphoribosyltransferase [Candidatus Merdousia gallistercoris]
MNGEKTKRALSKVASKKNLSGAESAEVFGEIMSGEVDEAIMAAFLTALKMKGETVDEVVGAASAMRARATFINAGSAAPIDTCGTGGDGMNTFNISTTSAFIAAGAGVPVAKHGNRASTSKCGSGDVLGELGFNLDVHASVMEHCLQEEGIAFLFAPKMHPAMRFAAPVRKALGFRTIFNLLGPLVNPAGATGQVVGVFEAGYTEFVAECLNRMGVRRAFVVHAADGMDEISVCTPTRVSELRDCSIKTSEFNPRKYFPDGANFSDLKGGDAKVNAQILLDVLSGKLRNGARDICLLNAAAAIVVGGKTDDFGAALEMARDSLDSGAALKKLKTLVEFSRQNV